MPLYETIFITRQEVSSQDIEKITASFSKTLVDNGGTVVKTEQWGLRDLAYMIKKSNKAYYTLLGIDAPFVALKELERKLSLSEDVLRHVTVRVKSISKNPSAPIARSNSYEEEAMVAEDNNEAQEN
jgi:small subunit ribosomal protein S6